MQLRQKMTNEEKEEAANIIQDAKEWLSENRKASTEEFKEKQDVVMNVWTPIIGI